MLTMTRLVVTGLGFRLRMAWWRRQMDLRAQCPVCCEEKAATENTCDRQECVDQDERAMTEVM